MVTDKRAKAQRHIQSIDVGFRVVSVLENAGEPLTLKAIAERAEMAASKAHLYLASFVRVGLVARDPQTGRYGLGSYAVQLGLAALRQVNIIDLVREPMSRLHDEFALSTYASVWGNRGPTIVSKIDGGLEVPLAIQLGSVIPLPRSATGRAFLGAMPGADASTMLEQQGLSRGAAMRELKSARADIEKYGVTASDSAVFDGFAAVAAPIFNHAGFVAAAITVLGLRSRVDRSLNGTLSRRLRAICLEVGAALGCQSPTTPPSGGARRR